MSVGAHPTQQPGTEEYQPVFVGKTLEQLSEILARYPTEQAALLPALWLGRQGRRGGSHPDIAPAARGVGVTAADATGVVTVSTMCHQHPRGGVLVQGGT